MSKKEALPGVFGNRGTRAFISGEQREQRSNTGEQGTREIKILSLGNKGTNGFISGEQGNRYPALEGLKKKCAGKRTHNGFEV